MVVRMRHTIRRIQSRLVDTEDEAWAKGDLGPNARTNNDSNSQFLKAFPY